MALCMPNVYENGRFDARFLRYLLRTDGIRTVKIVRRDLNENWTHARRISSVPITSGSANALVFNPPRIFAAPRTACASALAIDNGDDAWFRFSLPRYATLRGNSVYLCPYGMKWSNILGVPSNRVQRPGRRSTNELSRCATKISRCVETQRGR